MRTYRAVRSFPAAVQLLLVNQAGVNTGFYLLVPYLASHLGENLGLSAAVVGLVLGVRTLSQQGLFIIGGTASDRLGARGVIIAGCGLRTVGFALFAFGDDLPVLLAASVLSGLAGALFNPAVRAYIATESSDRKAEAFALFNVFATTGALVGPLLGSLLLLVDFRAAALAAAGLFAVLTVAQALLLPARRVAPSGGSVLGDWREVLGNRRFLAFALAMMGVITLENQLYLLLADGARRASGWDGAVSLLFLAGTCVNLLLQVRITRRLHATGRRARWIALGLAVMGLAFVPPIAVAAADPPESVPAALLRLAPLLAAAVLLQLGVMIGQPFVLELIPAFGRTGLTGTYYGVFYVLSGVAAAGGNALIGWAMDAGADRGAAWLPWVSCVAIGLAGAAAVARLGARGALPEPAAATPPEAGTAPAAARPNDARPEDARPEGTGGDAARRAGRDDRAASSPRARKEPAQ
ncbi:MFS transporter [Allostreptomyces psammosilenae]|uniref:MFS family permease n=1 Tax=Allostreptomyces psammosilenae TaxID=1892865 RepID=A0A853A196_9ACTN|nr:MFS transporter [Allostreptomyces psammosilenae]NYI07907.1 MFS family permease [Allostreptomyces psammosilenae]